MLDTFITEHRKSIPVPIRFGSGIELAPTLNQQKNTMARGSAYSRFEVRTENHRFIIDKKRVHRLTSILDSYGREYRLMPMI